MNAVKYVVKLALCRESNFFFKQVCGVTAASACSRWCSTATNTDPQTAEDAAGSKLRVGAAAAAATLTQLNTAPESAVDSEEVFHVDKTIEPNVVVKEMRNPFWNIENDYDVKDSSGVPHFIDDIKPPLPASFNLAAYVNKSRTLQKLMELGVDLSKINENAETAKFIMRLEFETDMKAHIQFLHDNGVPADNLGYFITKNPLIFREDLENLQIRINYLESKKFDKNSIARIISKNPLFLMKDTKNVDRRLGYFQKTFSLTGDEVRFLITKCPKLISYEHRKLLEKVFILKEEMGFSPSEMKKLLLMKPKVWMLGRKNLERRFNIVHNMMGLSHDDILKYPGLLLKRGFLLEQRHKYLVHLGRAQYDPTKPGYVSIKDIATTTDNAFCKRCAKTSVAAYNEFLKTL